MGHKTVAVIFIHLQRVRTRGMYMEFYCCLLNLLLSLSDIITFCVVSYCSVNKFMNAFCEVLCTSCLKFYLHIKTKVQ